MQLYGYVSAKIKQIDCFLECASFIGCQANKALVAETSAVQQTGREKNVTEKRGMEIKNRQAQNLSLTKFLPIAMASCGQACCQDIFCRLSLSSSNWTLDGVSSPPFGAFNGRRTCLLL